MTMDRQERRENEREESEGKVERETTFAPTQVRGSADRGRDEVSFRSRRVAGTSAPREKEVEGTPGLERVYLSAVHSKRCTG